MLETTGLLPLVLKLAGVQLYSLLAAVYCHQLVRRVTPGLPRLLVALPLILSCLVVPLLLDHEKEPILVTPLAGVFSLAAFKVAAYCINRGPLTLKLSPLQFAAVLLVPIIPYDVFAVSGGKAIPPEAGGAPRAAGQLLRDYGKQIGCACVVALVLAAYPQLHWFPRHWLYTLCSCMFLGGVFDLLGACVAPLGIPVAPTFNRPWMSDNFADFWARRWNLTTTYMMRTLVYEPIMQGQLIKQQQPGTSAAGQQQPQHADGGAAGSAGGLSTGASAAGLVQRSSAAKSAAAAAHAAAPAGAVLLSDAAPAGPLVEDDRDVSSKQNGAATKAGVAAAAAPAAPAAPPRKPRSQLRRLLALQATFMFSGVWHILVFWYNTRVISLRWALFFIIQAPIVMAEALLSRAWERARLPALPHALRVVLTNAALIAIAGPLFFGPADDTGFAPRNIAAVRPILHMMAPHRFPLHAPTPLSGSEYDALLSAAASNDTSSSSLSSSLGLAAGSCGMSSAGASGSIEQQAHLQAATCPVAM